MCFRRKAVNDNDDIVEECPLYFESSGGETKIYSGYLSKDEEKMVRQERLREWFKNRKEKKHGKED